jgi:hypothetical protein
MKIQKIEIYLYLFLLFISVHVRWFFVYLGDRWLLALPALLVSLSIVLIPKYVTGRNQISILLIIALPTVLGLNSLLSIDWTYGVESIVIVLILFITPISALGAPIAFRYISNSRTGKKILLVFAVAMIVQTIWLAFEVQLGLSNFFRPDIIGTNSEWFFNNRYGVDRAKYTFSSPMTAGAWSWFCGLILIVLGGHHKSGSSYRIFFLATGILTWCGMVFCISRGPAIVAICSFIALLIIYINFENIIKYGFRFIFSLASLYYLLIVWLEDDLLFSLVNIAKDTFSADDDGNSTRISIFRKAADLIINIPAGGNGLHSISYLIGADEINLENTFLNLIYGTGYAGVFYSVTIIICWLYGLIPLWLSLGKIRKMGPLAIITFAMGNGWFLYMFFYPCLREIELSIITFSILCLLLLKPWEIEVGVSGVRVV